MENSPQAGWRSSPLGWWPVSPTAGPLACKALRDQEYINEQNVAKWVLIMVNYRDDAKYRDSVPAETLNY